MARSPQGLATETSLCYKNRPKTRVFTEKRMEKNYETGKKCEASFTKEWNWSKKMKLYETLLKVSWMKNTAGKSLHRRRYRCKGNQNLWLVSFMYKQKFKFDAWFCATKFQFHQNETKKNRFLQDTKITIVDRCL